MAKDLVEFLVRQQAELPHRVVIRLQHATDQRYEHQCNANSNIESHKHCEKMFNELQKSTLIQRQSNVTIANKMSVKSDYF